MKSSRISRLLRVSAALGAALVLVSGAPAFAQGASAQSAPASDSEELAKKLANPVASMISVPFQFNESHGMGPEENGRQFLVNFQPVMPFKLNDNWNLIARIIVPTIGNPVLVDGVAPSNGIGDILISEFFSPVQSPFIWGVGTAFGLPVSSDPTLGTGKYLLGPTFVGLKQMGPWTYGALVNHVWDIGGDEGRKDVDQTFLQPFVSWGKQGWTVVLQGEASANWEADEGQTWTVPIYAGLSKVVRVGKTPMSIGAGPRFWAASPDGGPSVGFRFNMALIIPTGN